MARAKTAIRHEVELGCSCGAKKGRPHKPPCEYEECPFCHGQLISCDCCYKILGIDPDKEPTYSNGLTKKQEQQWNARLKEIGLIPEGSEVRRRAGIWTPEYRTTIIEAISREMALAAHSDEYISSDRIILWSSRISLLATASNVMLEMNRGHILQGRTLIWSPPK